MNDEVVVTELMDRGGIWPEAPSPARSRFRVVAVMLAVVLGCGLAALLVHIGSEQRLADNPNPAIFDLPHGPSGGLAGGGVPASPEETEVTVSSTSVVVTNELPPTGSYGLPWAKHHQQASTGKVTESPTGYNATDGAIPPSAPGGTGGGNGFPPPNPQPDPMPNRQPNPPANSGNPPTSAQCVLNLVCLPTG